MADSCGDYISADDLKAGKQSILHIEHVATSKDAQGNPALTVTDTIRGNEVTNTTLDGLFADIGFKPVNGSFEDGATLNNRWEVLLYESNGQYYQWMGALPKTVPAGSTPTSTGGVGPDAWVSQSDLTLRSQLASTAGASLVNTQNGETVQERIDSISESILNISSYVTAEQYSDLVVDDDWSDAINAALATGKTLIPVADKTYKITKIINSQGQPFLGSIKLQLARTTIPNATFSIEHTKATENDHFRAIYVQSAYDLAELLRIKSMGFNTVLHYCYFDNNGSIDIAGTIPQLIKNAATAGLNVVINTENSVSHNNGTISQVVSAADGYENVIGYSVIDEPASRGFTLAQQESAISALRALTKKKLFCVDYLWAYLNTWTKPWSYNYDVFLVDSYSMYYASGTLDQRIEKDLGKMRTDFGAALKMTGNAKVIPCFQAYVDPTSTPVEARDGTYCFDVPQITGAGKVFGQVANGDYACFIWDGGFNGNVANNGSLQTMISEIANHAGKGQKKITEGMIFGGVASVYQRSLSEVAAKIGRANPDVSGFRGGGAWPTRLVTGSTDGMRTTTTANIDLSGIGFYNTFSQLVTTQKAYNYVTAMGVFENYGNALTGSAALELKTTPDAGYIENLIYSGGVTPGQPFRLSSKVTNNYDGVGENLMICLSLQNTSDAMANIRRFIYGGFFFTNW